MAGISIKEIDHLAHLTRIELTPAEKKKYAEQISDILGYIKKLDGVNVQEEKAIDRTKVLENVMREDEIATEGKRQATKKEMLRNVPMIKDGYIKVKAILNA